MDKLPAALRLAAGWLLLLGVAGACAVSSNDVGRTVISSPSGLPDDWQIVRRAPVGMATAFTVALTQRNLDQLEKVFWEVSDPSHPKYGQHLSRDDISAMVSPLPGAKSQVEEWLQTVTHESRIEDYGDALWVQATSSEIECLFATKMYVMEHKATGAQVIRNQGDMSVPQHIVDIIDFVSGVSDLPHVPHPETDPEEPVAVGFRGLSDSGDAMIIPYSARALYGVKDSDVVSSPSVSQGVAQFQPGGAGFAYSDKHLQEFASQVGTGSVTVDHKVGPFDTFDTFNSEPNLDIQYLTSVGEKASNWYWTTEGWMYDMALQVFNATDAPQVLSISYGWTESEQCASIVNASCSSMSNTVYVQRTNTEFMKIGARGISLIVASGDSGANGRSDDDCSSSPIEPDFPASSPYVTTVGATMVSDPQTGPVSGASACTQFDCITGGSEVACQYPTGGITSGGGFSKLAPRPSYQDDAVTSWTSSGATKPPTSMFSTNNRGYPDVAAVGHNILMCCKLFSESLYSTDGTSASTPIFAGLVALLNDKRVSNGKSALGFLNPMLYKMAKEKPSAFNDITVGDNKCTETTCCDYGYGAAKGWDPVTGLGTLNFQDAAAYVSTLS